MYCTDFNVTDPDPGPDAKGIFRIQDPIRPKNLHTTGFGFETMYREIPQLIHIYQEI
jgi:hypothetical protein